MIKEAGFEDHAELILDYGNRKKRRKLSRSEIAYHAKDWMRTYKNIFSVSLTFSSSSSFDEKVRWLKLFELVVSTEQSLSCSCSMFHDRRICPHMLRVMHTTQGACVPKEFSSHNYGKIVKKGRPVSYCIEHSFLNSLVNIEKYSKQSPRTVERVRRFSTRIKGKTTRQVRGKR